MRESLAQGFGTIGQQITERQQALASARRPATFPFPWRTKKQKRIVEVGAEHPLSTELHSSVVVAPESGSPIPRGSGQLVDLDTRRVYSRRAERYWIVRSGDEELRFSHRSAAERWATTLAGRDSTSELKWHDEHTVHTVGVTPKDRGVA
jgi:hypothetical protein